MLLIALVATVGRSPAVAQELLTNPSFESPVGPNQGNNLYTTIPGWTATAVTPAQSQPFNLVHPYPGYANNPTTTPTNGGIQYLDINSADGIIVQTITVPSTGMIDIGGWFATRDITQNLTGLTVRVRNSGGTIIATASTTFVSTEAIGTWKYASLANTPVTAGTYTFEAVIPNFANFDLATVYFKPAPTFTTTSAPVSDPTNGTNNPKFTPGGVAEYTIGVALPSSYSLSNNSFSLTDVTPANSELVVGDIGGASTGPVSFTANSSTLTYNYSGLSSLVDDVDFSNDGGSTWVYSPSANANGVDPSVTNIRVRPQGTMAAGSSVSLHVRYRVK